MMPSNEGEQTDIVGKQRGEKGLSVDGSSRRGEIHQQI